MRSDARHDEELVFPTPVGELAPNTYAYERTPLIKPAGFREYDARWLFGTELNMMGVEALGMGLGTMLHEIGAKTVVTGHDYRSYSSSIKAALTAGLMAAGMRVHDIGLALTPMAYFAQFALDVPAVAMVTASHNDNGWTGVKMGAAHPLTFGPDEMSRLREIVLSGAYALRGGGSYVFAGDIAQRYMDDLVEGRALSRKMKVVVACGNGTAGAFAPQVIERLGCEVVPLDTELDYTFPHYNPNPEDMKMLWSIGEKVRESGADIGLGFDGDGDRCGIVDNKGEEIFADKIGVMLARDISKENPGATFVVDVKSTDIYATDPVLLSRGVKTDYWKTGHSHIKHRVHGLGALAGFEKSGHFFFNQPLGRGYDDGLRSAIAVLEMLGHNQGKSIADLYADLPKTWGSPTMSPHCADEKKYDIVEKATARFQAMREKGERLIGQPIRDIVTVNGVRVTVEDGTWGLVRASSNKPELVVVVESPVSDARMREMFTAVDTILRENREVGEYNQKIASHDEHGCILNSTAL